LTPIAQNKRSLPQFRFTWPASFRLLTTGWQGNFKLSQSERHQVGGTAIAIRGPAAIPR
jgi:hypothetical protein